MLQDMGNAVKVNDKIIPAVNIQVENIPEGYGIYFEIMFYSGSLWVVTYDEDSPNIVVTYYVNFADGRGGSCISQNDIVDWDHFVASYEAYLDFLEDHRENYPA